LFAALELGEDKLFGHIKPRKTRARFLEFCRYLRTLYPPTIRIAIICDNFSPHLTTRKDKRVGQWAAASNTEIAYTPTNSSWLNLTSLTLVRTQIVVDSVEGVAEVVGQGVGGGEGMDSGLDVDGFVAAGGLDEFAD
jgi:hypothetical protein